MFCGVRICEVERWARNHIVLSSIPGNRCQLLGCSLTHVQEYWCSSQGAESRDILISCKNLL